MTNERWEEIKGIIKDKFEVLDERIEPLPEVRGEAEIIEFIGSMGKMKLERTNQPLVIDKKAIGSRRIGSKTTVEYIYSDTEKVHKFRAYRWNEDDKSWVKMEMERGGFFT